MLNHLSIIIMRNLFILSVTVSLLLWTSVPVIGQTREINMGEIVRQSDREVKLISILSSDKAVQNRIITAFNLHGAYAIKPSGQSNFTFRFIPVGSDRMQLAIESGNPLKTQYTETVSGRDREEAALRAADLAVFKTLGVPGFFTGKLAFVGDRSGHSEIYTTDLLFTRVRQITRDQSHSVLPHWSPDASRINYTSYYRNGFPDIYTIDLATLQRNTMASFKGTNMGGEYNPRGTEVAMVLSGTGNTEIYIGNSLGRNLRRITRSPAVESDPTWSPNGERIAFTSNRLGKPQLFEVSTRGGDAKRIPTNNSGNCTEPTWNPRHANIIAFTAAVGKEFEIALFDFNKKQSRWLTRGAGDAIEPCWTQDGRHLVYTARTKKSRRLILIDTVTGKMQRLSPDNLGNVFQAAYVSSR